MTSRTRQGKAGFILIVAALALPVATYVGAQAWMRYLASQDPVPNQGAMVVAFLAVCGSAIVALGVLALGVTLSVRARRPGA